MVRQPLTQWVMGAYHHHEGGVDVAGIIVADEREVEQVLALVAAGEGLILIEAQHHMTAVAWLELQQA